MKRFILLITVAIITIPAFCQETIDSARMIDLVEVIEQDGMTIIRVGEKNILHLSETEDGIQIDVDDDDLVTIEHEDNRVILKMRKSALSDLLNENEITGEKDIDMAIGQINERLLQELENSEIDEDEVDVEIENDEVHFDIEDKGLLEIREYDDGVKITIREKNLVDIEENRDTTKIRIGKKGIKIVEDEDGTSVEVTDIDEDDKEVTYKRRNKKFKGHWAGFEIGLNNYLDPNFSMSRPEGQEYMDLHTGRSINVNINFIQYNLGLVSDKVGLTTGMGMEFTNYFFDKNNNIAKDPVTGEIYELDYTPLGINLNKSKLTMTYLTVPIILEAQIGGNKRSKRLHISAGAIGGLKIGSHTKVVYRQSGSKEKDKNRNDFNLNALRYGFTARIGYQAINLYANYYMIPLFEKDKGPELYPIYVGLALAF